MYADTNQANCIPRLMGMRRNFFEQLERELDVRAEYLKIENAVCNDCYHEATGVLGRYGSVNDVIENKSYHSSKRQ